MQRVGTVVGVSLAATVAVLLGSTVRGGRASLDYAHDIAPIFARSCADCHAGEKPRGGLRLDQPARLSTVVTPGKSADSELVHRLLGQGGDERMPAGRAPLPAREIELVRRWIDQGARGLPAPAPPAAAPVTHWAYRAPVRPPLPAVRDASWSRNDIDRFILARLEQVGLAPAPEADPATLIRRVTLDLTGLPPSPAEIDAFLDERAHAGRDRAALDAAYERAVDRLLASPHFGERWAVPWLDLARYADSNGYEKDAARSIWKYRDWVVGALNADMPFDRFTLEQLAGDLLPGATVAQRIATGFHRNTMLNEEGGVDPEEARFERMCDRAATTATVWLGTTLGCARCHDHKHDPFSQRDFYGLLAFFDGAREETMPLPTPAQAQRLEEIRAARAPLAQSLATWTPALGEAQRRWERELAALPARFPALGIESAASSTGAPLVIQPDGSVFVSGGMLAGGVAGAAAEPEIHTIAGSTALTRVSAVRLEALPDARLPGGGPGRGPDGAFFLTGVDIEAAAAAEPGARWQPIAITSLTADDRPREEPERYAAENLLAAAPAGDARDADVTRGWGTSPIYDGAERLPRQLVLVPAQRFGFEGGTRIRVRLRYAAAAQGEVIGRFRLSATDADEPGNAPGKIAELPARLRHVAAMPESARARSDGNELAQAFRQLTPLLAGERARLAALDREERELGVVSTLVTAAPASGARVPETRLRQRGAFASPGEAVAAGVPAVFAPPPATAPRDRLALARWLVSDGNPLVGRVTANRVWAQYFGRGLVETGEDFGSQGSPPTHPELLDWLATELPRAGWHLKALHRLIVTSATYRQASRPAAGVARAVAVRDPEDRLLAHAPRRRLDAEMVRDVTLAASGRLDARVGGPPVFPPQPPGVWSPPNSHEGEWRDSAAPDRYRRALYTFWRRTAPYPSAALFDTPSREGCTVRRGRTSTPLQALATLNDPAGWEAARALGGRMRDEPAPPAGTTERIAHGFRLCTGRPARAREVQPLRALFERERARLGDDAAWALVANVLLNLDETLTNH